MISALIDWLKDVKHKTGLIAMLLAVLVTLQGVAIDAGTLLWLNLIAGSALLVFKAIAPTGLFPKGWTFWFWVANGAPVVLEIINLMSGSTLFGEVGIVTLGKIQMYIAAAFAGVQIYLSTRPTTEPS